MNNYKYVNNCTGELYRSIFHALKTIFSDMRHFPKCRTLEMFSISKLK